MKISRMAVMPACSLCNPTPHCIPISNGDAEVPIRGIPIEHPIAMAYAGRDAIHSFGRTIPQVFHGDLHVWGRVVGVRGEGSEVRLPPVGEVIRVLMEVVVGPHLLEPSGGHHPRQGSFRRNRSYLTESQRWTGMKTRLGRKELR